MSKDPEPLRIDEGDEEIERIRAARHEISAQFGHDPYRLVAHYMKLQTAHPEKLVSAPDAELANLGRK
jgi:hypothetical protein